jgi:hypothetical protein
MGRWWKNSKRQVQWAWRWWWLARQVDLLAVRIALQAFWDGLRPVRRMVLSTRGGDDALHAMSRVHGAKVVLRVER